MLHWNYCIFQSERYSIWDTLFYIPNTSTTYWETSANVTVTAGTDDVHFSANNTGGQSINLKKDNSIHSFDGTNGLTIEFDLKNSNALALYLVNHSGSRVKVCDASTDGEYHHYKWDYNPSTQKVTYSLDSGTGTDVDLSSQTMTTLGFQIYDWNGDIDAYIKGWKIYYS